MAGFFGFFDYTKPGPGVPKPGQGPKKGGIKIFFEVLKRKFWKILKLNMMYFIANLPGIAVAVFLAIYITSQIDYAFSEVMEDVEFVSSPMVVWIVLLITTLPIITFGPSRAGFDAVLRNYSREEHAFLLSDFIDNFKSNFKQAIIVGLIDVFVFIVIVIDFIFYWRTSFTSPIIQGLLGGLFLLVTMIYVMMHIYIYPLMTSFYLKTKEIIRNAFLFSIMRFIPNIIILIICGAIVTVPLLYLNDMFVLLISFIITYGLIGFILNFFAHRGFLKYMMRNTQAKKTRKDIEDEENDNKEEKVFNDQLQDKFKKQKTQEELEKIKEKYKNKNNNS